MKEYRRGLIKIQVDYSNYRQYYQLNYIVKLCFENLNRTAVKADIKWKKFGVRSSECGVVVALARCLLFEIGERKFYLF